MYFKNASVHFCMGVTHQMRVADACRGMATKECVDKGCKSIQVYICPIKCRYRLGCLTGEFPNLLECRDVRQTAVNKYVKAMV